MRTLDQNSYYHGVVVKLANEFYTKNPDKFFTDAYNILKGEEGQQVVHAMLKILFNSGRSTQFKDDNKGKGVEKMGNYIDSIREFFYRHHDFDIPPSNTPRIDYERA